MPSKLILPMSALRRLADATRSFFRADGNHSILPKFPNSHQSTLVTSSSIGFLVSCMADGLLSAAGIVIIRTVCLRKWR
jgi:hypothetical protein